MGLGQVGQTGFGHGGCGGGLGHGAGSGIDGHFGHITFGGGGHGLGSGHFIIPAHFSGVSGSGGGQAFLHKPLLIASSSVGSLHNPASIFTLGHIHEGHFWLGGIVDFRTKFVKSGWAGQSLFQLGGNSDLRNHASLLIVGHFVGGGTEDLRIYLDISEHLSSLATVDLRTYLLMSWSFPIGYNP